MVDSRLIELVRHKLAGANIELAYALRLLRKAELPDEARVIQDTIDEISHQIDQLSMLPTNKAIESDRTTLLR